MTNSNFIFSPKLLASKTALVTGASGGIGKACVLHLLQCGCNVVAVARNQQKLEQLHNARIDGQSAKLQLIAQDVTDSQFIATLKSFSNIDILVNNVGINIPKPLIDTEDAIIEQMVNVNVVTTIKITRTVIANMLLNNIAGSIVNLSSQMGHVGSLKRSIYCACKHAIEGFTKALAVELAPNNIRVNTVAPTFVATDMTKNMLLDDQFKQFVLNSIPLNRMASTDEVANAVVYLASSASAMTTGSTIKVDGGWTAQ